MVDEIVGNFALIEVRSIKDFSSILTMSPTSMSETSKNVKFVVK